MKQATYIYALLCTAIVIASAAYFLSVLIGVPISEHMPNALQRPFVYLVVAIGPLLGLMYFAQGIRAIVRSGLPATYSGWRYGLGSIGLVIAVLIIAFAVCLLLFAKPGGASGIPIALGLMASFLFAVPSLTTRRHL